MDTAQGTLFFQASLEIDLNIELVNNSEWNGIAKNNRTQCFHVEIAGRPKMARATLSIIGGPGLYSHMRGNLGSSCEGLQHFY